MADEQRLPLSDRALIQMDRYRPTVKNAVLAAAPTAAIGRAFNLSTKKIVPLTLGAAALGVLDQQVASAAKNSRALARKLPNYASANKAASGEPMRERATVQGFLNDRFGVQHLQEPEKVAEAPAPKPTGIPWNDSPILAKLASYRPELARLAREQL
ncbi:hypothetical protein EBT31_07590 [bacterium]|nr:hypothetical protein [bacterium]